MNYILMGDIINSRKKDTVLLWQDFNEIIKKSNEEYNTFMLSPLEIKIGDEFQVIMKDINSTFSLLYYLNTYLMHKNIKMRFVVGYGEIESAINKDSQNNMLGYGLTQTYEILNKKKKKNRYRFYIQDNEKMTSMLNTIGNLLSEIETRITAKQYQYLYYKIVLKYTIEEIIDTMNVSRSNLYQIERRSNYKLFQETFSSIEKEML